ncbi:MAG: class I SAM-dependent methyltransferase [Proteobacteria bacterium]|nr:class I SAM-dependent methyltransferase [Pseudomonadota bacterium]
MNLDPYRDPVLYDLEYAGHSLDIAWYTSLVGGVGGPVLELGCGTGRIALPLLRDGHEVVGVDVSQPMLDAMQTRLAAEPEAVQARASLHRADFRTLDLGRTFPTVLLPFNALHHCRDEAEVEALLASVRRHLSERGVFGLDCYLPDVSLYARDPEQRYEERVFRRPDTQEEIVSWERSWYDESTRVHHVQYIYRQSDGTEQTMQLDLRMWTHEELHAHLKAAGFTLLNEMADFEGTPMGPGALQSVLVLTA